jgi:stage II sporulation protein D
MTRQRPLALICALLASAVTAGSATAASVCSTSCFQAPAGSGALLVFSGHGWGHGVGMSQYGAYGYAQHGSTYAQILDHYYPGTTLGPAPTGTIRVLLADKKKSLKLVAGGRVIVRDGAGGRHVLQPGTATFAAASLDWPTPLTLKAAPKSYLGFGANRYRGSFLLDVVDGKLRLIDVVSLEQYLWGVVPSEMPSSWAAEALKAQAVAARSYALATRAVGAPFDVYSDTRSQMYLGVGAESASATAAVNATKGTVVLWQGKVATTFFSSTSGGQTESSANWTGTTIPYLVSVPDPYDSLSPYHDWGPVPVTSTTLLKALKATGPVTDVTTTPSSTGRVAQVKLTTPAKGLTIPATTLRGDLGLRSTWFTVGLLALTPPQPVAPVAYGSMVTLASVVRGLQGVSLEQKPAGGTWTTVRPATTGKLTATPTVTTAYRLATSAYASGAVTIKVVPSVALTAATTTTVSGTVNPVLPNAAAEVQVGNMEMTWTTVATTFVAADGTFSAPVTLTAGQTIRVVVTPGSSYAPGTSASQVVSP